MQLLMNTSHVQLIPEEWRPGQQVILKHGCAEHLIMGKKSTLVSNS